MDLNAKELTVAIKDGLVSLTVPVAELKGGYNAHYKMSNNRLKLVDVRSGHTYELGDTIPVKIASVDRSRDVIIATTDLHKKLELPQAREEVSESAKGNTIALVGQGAAQGLPSPAELMEYMGILDAREAAAKAPAPQDTQAAKQDTQVVSTPSVIQDK